VRKLPVLFFTIAALPAAAIAQETQVERLLELSREANGECQKADLPKPALDAACQSGQAYNDALAELGFCLDAESGEWRGCAAGTSPRTRVPPPQGPAGMEPVQPEPEANAAPAPIERYTAPEPPPAPSEDPEEQSQGEPGDEPLAETSPLPEPAPEQEPGEAPAAEEWAAAQEGEWRTYFNPRFGTVADIPAWQFRPGTGIEEDEGQTFVSQDGGDSEIAVYGTMLEGQPFREYRDWYRSELSGISYEAGGRNWFVMSGRAEGKIYYVKAVRSERCGVEIAHHIVLRYPNDLKRQFDPLVERLADSLRGSTPESYCG
jgi:hypothetical protein